MRRLASWVALLALAASGCAYGGDVADPPDPDESSTAIDLSPDLITINEFPDGWTLAESTPGSVGSMEQLAACPALRINLKAPNASAVYAGGESGPFASDTVIQPTQEVAIQTVAAAKSAPTSCKTFTSAGIRYRLAELPFPKVAQDSVALRMTATVKGAKLVCDIVMLRSADDVAVLTYVGTTPDEATLQVLAKRAAQNFVD